MSLPCGRKTAVLAERLKALSRHASDSEAFQDQLTNGGAGFQFGVSGP